MKSIVAAFDSAYRATYVLNLGERYLEQLLTRNPMLESTLDRAKDAYEAERHFIPQREQVVAKVAQYWEGLEVSPDDIQAVDDLVQEEGRLRQIRDAANAAASEELIKAIEKGSGGKAVITPHIEFDQSLSSKQRTRILDSVNDFEQMLGVYPSGAPLKIASVSEDEKNQNYARSYYTKEDNSIHFARTAPPTVWHELGHMMEDQTPGAEAAAHAYLELVAPGPSKNLQDIDTARPGYGSKEQARIGNFPQPYVGKDYGTGTELTSMAMQFVREDPGVLWAYRSLLYYVLGMICGARQGFPWSTEVEADFDPSESRDNTGKWTKSGDLEPAPANKEEWPEHIKGLKLPPAWTDVKINSDPKADLLAIGKDAKGRAQYVYSQKFQESQSAMKFARIKELDVKFEKVRGQNEERLKSDDPKLRENAACSRLVMAMGIRPGSDDDTKAKVKAYGATTLEGRHVVQEGDQTYLRFTGKKGVSINLPVTDPAIAKDLLARAQTAGPTGKLFQNVSDTSLLDYTHSLDGGGFKTKDFRTLLATRSAMQQVSSMPAPKNEKEFKKQALLVAKAVSARLGNTPTVALQSYIAPEVFTPWRMKLAEAA